MSTDNNKLSLKVIGSPQPADNSSSIEAEAVAYIDAGTGVITYPDPVEVVFELPKGSGALFTDTNAETTSRKTLKASGRIQTPVYFKSSQAVANGNLRAYWQDDPANTLQQKPFTFEPVVKPSNNVYFQAYDKTYAYLGYATTQNGNDMVTCWKTTPDDSCKFVIEPNGDGTVALRTADGKYFTIEKQAMGGVLNTIEAGSGPKAVFDIQYYDGGASMTIQWIWLESWGKLYVSAVSGVFEPLLLAAVKTKPDPSCYFTVTPWDP
jgi:hypothetical protein